MSASHFVVHHPASLPEALDLLTAHRASVRLLAGGTDLVPKLKAGVLEVANLVSLRKVPGLDQVSFSQEEGLIIGASARLSLVAALPQARTLYPALAYACSVMATTQIRNMGTVAGNLANAAPSADTAAPLLVYDAVLQTLNSQGGRSMALAEFFAGPGLNALEPDEIITSIKVPVPEVPSGSDYQRLSARSRVDIAAVGVAGFAGLDGQGRISRCRLALAAVAPTPLRCREAEESILGQKPEATLLKQAAAQAAAACSPIDDVRASAAYRRTMVEVLARRVLESCLSQAQGGAQ